MTAEKLNQIAQLPGVSGVVIDLKASIYGDGKDTWDANVQVIRPWLLPPGVTTQQLGNRASRTGTRRNSRTRPPRLPARFIAIIIRRTSDTLVTPPSLAQQDHTSIKIILDTDDSF